MPIHVHRKPAKLGAGAPWAHRAFLHHLHLPGTIPGCQGKIVDFLHRHWVHYLLLALLILDVCIVVAELIIEAHKDCLIEELTCKPGCEGHHSAEEAHGAEHGDAHDTAHGTSSTHSDTDHGTTGGHDTGQDSHASSHSTDSDHSSEHSSDTTHTTDPHHSTSSDTHSHKSRTLSSSLPLATTDTRSTPLVTSCATATNLYNVLCNSNLPTEKHLSKFSMQSGSNVEYPCEVEWELELNHTLHVVHAVLHWMSVGILCVFEAELLLLLFALRHKFCKHPLFVLDLLVVTASLVLDLVLHEADGGLLILVRLWRFARIFHGVSMSGLEVGKEAALEHLGGVIVEDIDEQPEAEQLAKAEHLVHQLDEAKRHTLRKITQLKHKKAGQEMDPDGPTYNPHLKLGVTPDNALQSGTSSVTPTPTPNEDYPMPATSPEGLADWGPDG
eukprot:TRINITY_DN1526_c0_g1_i1.p1 TRINITY_DN1526_c0_g1~~TRINITY_DN1526_c0_g1_i1.p1  ORF type:complete len:442 (+),score=7.02 TRINITY_DN1526_c0_g1_i1:43-1368(+)